MAAVTTLTSYQATNALAFSFSPASVSNRHLPASIAPCPWDPESKHFSSSSSTHMQLVSAQPNIITALANKALAEKLKSTMESLESSRGELGIAAYQLPVDDRRFFAIAESIVWSFMQPIKQQPICHKSSHSYVHKTENQECRVYVDTHTDNSKGSYKQCSPALLFVIKRIHDCCVVEGKWVAKIISQGDYALPYMFWEAAVYLKLKGLEGFPRLLEFFSTRGESNALSCEHISPPGSLDEAVNLKSYYEACKINQFIFYMDYHPENLHAAVVRENSNFALSSCITKLYRPLASMHEAKLVHMDLKPENIIAEGEGHDATFKLFDFNHSAPIGALSTITRGTAACKAPETWPTFSAIYGLCYPLVESADPAMDVWSMALVLHKMKLRSHVFQPWGELLKTLHIINKFQQKIGKPEINTSSTPTDEMQKKIAKDLSQLVSSVEVVQSHYKDWRIDNDCYIQDMKDYFDALKVIKQQFEAFTQFSPTDLVYFNNFNEQLSIIQHGLMSVLERYRICLKKNATATHADPFNFILSRAMHPDPTKRPSASEILHLCSQLQPRALLAHSVA